MGRYMSIGVLALIVTGIMFGSMALTGLGVGFGAIFGIWAIRTGFGTAASGSIASERIKGRVAEARRRQRWREARGEQDE